MNLHAGCWSLWMCPEVRRFYTLLLVPCPPHLWSSLSDHGNNLLAFLLCFHIPQILGLLSCHRKYVCTNHPLSSQNPQWYPISQWEPWPLLWPQGPKVLCHFLILLFLSILSADKCSLSSSNQVSISWLEMLGCRSGLEYLHRFLKVDSPSLPNLTLIYFKIEG